MNRDFHYGVVKTLALKAGFSANHSQIIAYASQYVDNADSGAKIAIKGIKEIRKSIPILADRIYNDHFFDPMVTFKVSGKKSRQKNVWIPFHFIPPTSKSISDSNFNYQCAPKGALVTSIVERIINKIKESDRIQEEHLIQLGVALHTYADTWAHSGFSGRRSNKDNDIENLKVNGRSKTVNPREGIPWSNIGHFEAYAYPDKSHVKFSYIQDYTQEPVKRNNTKWFLKASKNIYSHLCNARQSDNTSWESFKSDLKKCLSKKDTMKALQKTFGIEDNYHPKAWKNLALRDSETTISDYNSDSFQKELRNDFKWFYFHAAAFKQRQFVLDNIPLNLK